MTVINQNLYWLLFAVVAIGATSVLAYKTKPGWRRVLTLALCIFVFWHLAWLDDWLGQRELDAICEKEGGIRVYKAIELPAHQFGPEGIPVFVHLDEAKDERIVQSPDYGYSSKWESLRGTKFTRIQWRRSTIYKASDGQTLGVRNIFAGTRGGPPRPMEVDLRQCPSPADSRIEKLIVAVFKPAAGVPETKGSE